MRSGRGDLNQRIADCKYFVAQSSLPEDNLWRSYNLPSPNEEEQKLKEAYIESAFRVANSQPQKIPNIKATTRAETKTNKSWIAAHILDILKGILITVIGGLILFAVCYHNQFMVIWDGLNLSK